MSNERRIQELCVKMFVEPYEAPFCLQLVSRRIASPACSDMVELMTENSLVFRSESAVTVQIYYVPGQRKLWGFFFTKGKH
jgi:hypothetical protein